MKHTNHLLLNTTILLLLILPLIISCGSQAPQSPSTPAPVATPTTPAAPVVTPEPAPTPKPPEVPKEIELKYDDGSARDMLSVLTDCGYIIDFTPTPSPFNIKSVRIFGILAGTGWEGKNYSVTILDQTMQKVLFSVERPVTDFDKINRKWINVEIPNIKVIDKFYIHVYTGTGQMQGIHIGTDDSIKNEHSSILKKYPSGFLPVEPWPYSSSVWFGDKSKVNWMIRVVGN